MKIIIIVTSLLLLAYFLRLEKQQIDMTYLEILSMLKTGEFDLGLLLGVTG